LTRNEKGDLIEKDKIDCRCFEFPEDEEGFLTSGIRFPKTVDLSGAYFPKEIDFYGVNFEKGAYFKKTYFGGDVRFLSTHFGQNAAFYDVYFEAWAEFDVGFMGGASFLRCTFNGPLRLKGHYEGDLTFDGTTIYDEGYIRLEGNGEISFQQVRTLETGYLIIVNANLADWSFVNTPGLTNALFINVTWPTTSISRRKVVLDEKKIKKRKREILGVPSYEEVVNIYRRLRRNFEDRLAYGEAGDFHIGEMIMYRKDLFTKKKYLKWLFSWLYNLFSRYGESIWQPLAWLGGLFFAAAYFYWLSGQGVLGAIRASFIGFVTLQIDVSAGITGWLIPSLQRLLGIPLVTLFILALRRAFRR
jgi:hypothetical protein